MKNKISEVLHNAYGWELPCIEQVKEALTNTIATFTVYDNGQAVSLELISTKEAVLFYKKKGFEERPCEWDGPGMFKMILREA